MSTPKGTAEEAVRWMDWVLRCAEGVSTIPTDDLYDLYDFLERASRSLPTEADVTRGTRTLLHDLRQGGESPPDRPPAT